MVKKEPTPIYPPAALAEGLAADVTLALEIDAEGHVTGASVTKGAGQGFDEAALAAARQMELSPAEIDGKPAPIRIEYVIHFRPRAAAPAAGTTPAPVPPPPPPLSPPPPPPAPPPRLILRGRIRERGTRDPVSRATVFLLRRGATTGGADPAPEEIAQSDAEGRFEVRVIGEAPHGARLVVTGSSHEACVRDLTAAEVAAAIPVDWNCYAGKSVERYETRVHAERASPGVTRPKTLSPVELTTVPGTFGDPVRVLPNLPGVARPPYGLGLLIVRGASPADTGVYVGGQVIPQLYHFLIGPSVVAPHLLERIDFYPGGFGVRYGRITGGAVDVILKEGPSERLHGGVDVSVLDVSAYADGPLRDGTSATISVRRSTIDATLPQLVPRRRGSTFVTTVPVYWDYQARVVQELGRWGRAGVSAFGSDDSLQVVSQDPQAGNLSQDVHLGFHRVVGFWAGQRGPWSWRIAPAYGNGEDSFALGTSNGYIRYHRAYLRADLSRPIGGRFDVRAGVDALASHDTASFDTLFPRDGRTFGTTTLDRTQPRRTQDNLAPAVFVEAEWRPIPALQVTPGVRLDYYRVLGVDRHSIDPRLTVRWKARPGSLIKGGAGIYHQLPVGQFLDREFGNPNLPLIGSDQFHVGLEKKLTEAIGLDVTAYFLRRYGIPIPSTERFSGTGRGRAWGLEAWLRHAVTARFYGWLAYTLSWSEETGSSASWSQQTGPAAQQQVSGAVGGADASSAGTYHPSPFDQRHNLIAVASYTRGGWQLGARYRLTSGRPTRTVTGSFYDADFGGYTPQVIPAYSRLPLFNQLDLRIERTFTFDRWTLGVYLDVQNVLNAENPENFVYDYRFQQQAPVRGLPILPVIGLRGRW